MTFALATRSKKPPHGYWFVSRSSSRGNVMSTSSPFAALTFRTTAEAELWFLDLPSAEKDRLYASGLVVVDLEATVGKVHDSPWLKPDAPALDAVPSPPKRRRSA